MTEQQRQAIWNDNRFQCGISTYGTIVTTQFNPWGNIVYSSFPVGRMIEFERCMSFNSRREAQEACSNVNYPLWKGKLGQEARKALSNLLSKRL